MRMARPKFTPKTDGQRRAIAALKIEVKNRDEADTRVWEAARAARAEGVTARYIGEITGRTERTVHRHVPAPDGEDVPAEMDAD